MKRCQELAIGKLLKIEVVVACSTVTGVALVRAGDLQNIDNGKFMICENCVMDLCRTIVSNTGAPVNCLAYGCKNHKLVDDLYTSQCKELKNIILKTIEECTYYKKTNK